MSKIIKINNIHWSIIRMLIIQKKNDTIKNRFPEMYETFFLSILFHLSVFLCTHSRLHK
jgi:hypothetical protein